jgi:hypothetical protein
LRPRGDEHQREVVLNELGGLSECCLSVVSVDETIL